MDGEGQATPRGNIGNEIFDQIENMMQEQGLSRTNAFQRLSESTGRRAGTVAANYYRVARLRGATLQPRAPRGSKGRPSAVRGGAGSADAWMEACGVIYTSASDAHFWAAESALASLERLKAGVTTGVSLFVQPASLVA